ncbi:alpha-amylase [Alteromonas aestuariivivens]|uniref:Alpha-amylase n=2 Tax=Alteromonas aestuariivivens TaxID=1938339 RepID=A0A3D8M946_9ALTE|nr:alpha-amylase [Alteromonas aestuariivivens]
MSYLSEERAKPVVYQVFTRLFGNTNDTNQPWGTLEQNGVGKFSDFTDTALAGIRELGVSHIWYTGVPHHAVVTDYTAYGISNDDPDVVKGRAGSPYAVKDYYNVNPDLADDPSQRLQEFEALIDRTHRNGMKVIIDIVPNHVARRYESLTLPAGEENFGASDDTSVAYARDNNFYYVVGESFQVPEAANGYRPLGGEPHPLADGQFEEIPAKWTGNGARAARPDANDWYETVKINYGVRPDGSYDFDRLPHSYRFEPYQKHAVFWADKTVPDSWKKFRAITQYWLAKGVDGFRYDMAEMVPVEFWSYLNSAIKMTNPDAFLLAEVYQPDLYRDYLLLGKMDYLYDKVEFYDNLKWVMQGTGDAAALAETQQRMQDIEPHMLHFLENHDEQRIASPEFAGNADKGRPAMVVSALISRSPTMVYFGQEVGEDGSEETGFGDPSRTTIFDYAGVPAHQRWMNGGKFDGGMLSESEKSLREFYRQVLNISAFHPAMKGEYQSLHQASLELDGNYSKQQFAFVRWHNDRRLLVVSHFGEQAVNNVKVAIPGALIQQWQPEGALTLWDLLEDEPQPIKLEAGENTLSIDFAPLESKVYEIR